MRGYKGYKSCVAGCVWVGGRKFSNDRKNVCSISSECELSASLDSVCRDTIISFKVQFPKQREKHLLALYSRYNPLTTPYIVDNNHLKRDDVLTWAAVHPGSLPGQRWPGASLALVRPAQRRRRRSLLSRKRWRPAALPSRAKQHREQGL